MSAIRPITRSIRSKVAVLAVAGIAALGVTAGVAQATDYSSFNFGNTLGGTVSLNVVCDHYAHNGAAGVKINIPQEMSNGVYVDTLVYFKNSTQSWSNSTLLDHTTGLAKGRATLVSTGTGSAGMMPIWDGNVDLVSTKLFSGLSFQRYDVRVWYRVALPGATSWSQWFTLSANLIRQNNTQYAYFVDATQCTL